MLNMFWEEHMGTHGGTRQKQYAFGHNTLGGGIKIHVYANNDYSALIQ